MSDDYDDEFEGDDGGRGLVALLVGCCILWALVAIVTWAVR